MSHVENMSKYSIMRLPWELLGMKTVEPNSVKETTPEEKISQKSCCKREACKETRKDSCGSKGCKADRPTTKGDGRCH